MPLYDSRALAVVNMSGDPANPRKSIPLKTVSAIAISLVIYLLIALRLVTQAPAGALVENYTIMIDRAAWGPIVVAGLFGATFSSALSSLVGAPRILHALGEHRIMPASSFFAKRTAKGEPRNGMLLTGAIVIAALMLRDLHAIAPLITMFFLQTYAMINFVVFRPLLRVPRIVPLLGGVGCLFAMFIVNPVFSLVAVAIVLALYAVLVRKHLKTPYSDVRSGLFVALAEWAAKKMTRLSAARNYGELTESLPDLAKRFQGDHVFSNWTVIDAGEFGENLDAGIEALGGAFFRSNVVVLRLPEPDAAGSSREKELETIVADAARNELRVMIYSGGSTAAATEGPDRNSSDQSGGAVIREVTVAVHRPRDGWRISLELGRADLAVLAAIKISGNTGAALKVRAVVGDESEREEASQFLSALTHAARIPDAETGVVTEECGDAGSETPDSAAGGAGGLFIYPVGPDVGLDSLRGTAARTAGPSLFTIDSGKESAVA